MILVFKFFPNLNITKLTKNASVQTNGIDLFNILMSALYLRSINRLMF